MSIVTRQLRTTGSGSVTLAGIAREAACAKGLVSYHYQTKAVLLTAAAEELLREREERWTQALRVT
ncbi:MAG: TetR family transcriptional regulator, partial [Gemmatimonadetes bacterium]|nr:TetR family transcriptional regulator [Gemmatimonadota bacterium]